MLYSRDNNSDNIPQRKLWINLARDGIQFIIFFCMVMIASAVIFEKRYGIVGPAMSMIMKIPILWTLILGGKIMEFYKKCMYNLESSFMHYYNTFRTQQTISMVDTQIISINNNNINQIDQIMTLLKSMDEKIQNLQNEVKDLKEIIKKSNLDNSCMDNKNIEPPPMIHPKIKVESNTNTSQSKDMSIITPPPLSDDCVTFNKPGKRRSRKPRNSNKKIVRGTKQPEVSDKNHPVASDKMASVHVWNLDTKTKKEQIVGSLVEQFPEVICEEMKSKYPERYSSFKVSVFQRNVDKLMMPEIWNKDVLVDRFLHRLAKNTNAVKAA